MFLTYGICNGEYYGIYFMFLDDYSTSYISEIMQINYKLFETHFARNYLCMDWNKFAMKSHMHTYS